MKNPDQLSISEQFLKKDGLSRDEWNLLWVTVFSDVRLPDGNVKQVISDYYFNTLIMLFEAQSEHEIDNIVQRYAPLLDNTSRELIPFIASKMAIKGQWTDLWQTFNWVSDSYDGERLSHTHSFDAHLQEITSPEQDPQMRLWHMNTLYPYIEDSTKKFDIPLLRNNRVELGSLQSLHYLVGIFETKATGDRLLNSREIQFYHFQKLQDPLSAFVLLMHLANQNLQYLKFSANREDYEKIILNGLKYIEDNFPEGYTFEELNTQYPLIFEWLRQRLSLIGQAYLPTGISSKLLSDVSNQ